MKKIVILMLAAVLSLTACESRHHSKPVAPTTSAASSASAAVTSTPSTINAAEQNFLNQVRQLAPELAPYSDDTILVDTQEVCVLFDSGQTFEQVVNFEYQKYAPLEAGEIIGAGVRGFCPVYLPKLPTD